MKYYHELKRFVQIGGFSSTVAIALNLSLISQEAMRESPINASKYYEKEGLNKPFIVNRIDVDFLNQNGYVVIENVLDEIQLKCIRDDLAIMIKNNIFLQTEQHDEFIRTDSICWINQILPRFQKKVLGEHISSMIKLVRSIPQVLLMSGYEADEKIFGVPISNQLSRYNIKDGHYVAHRDTPDNEKRHFLQSYLQPGLQERKLTIILYLNDSKWDGGKSGTDGCLRIFLNTDVQDVSGESASAVVDIVPTGGKLVIFDSTKILHEVLPCNQERFAFTCWVGGNHGKYEYLRRYCIPREEMIF